MTIQPMFRVLAVGLSLLAVACGGGTPPAQEAAAPDAGPALAPGGATVLGDLIKDWERQKDALMGIADAMPEEAFAYKSTPAQRSYGEHVMHIATVNVDLLNLVGGDVPPPSFAADSATTKADMLQALRTPMTMGSRSSTRRPTLRSTRPSKRRSLDRPRVRACSGFCSGTRWTFTARWRCTCA